MVNAGSTLCIIVYFSDYTLINDIIHPVGTDINPFRPMSDLPTAQELIDGPKWYIEQAHLLHDRVYIGTLLPIYGWRTYAPFREEKKGYRPAKCF